MNISTIQKRRFLENLYKLYYSSGSKPTDQEIKKAFNDFFAINKPGFPLSSNSRSLSQQTIVNVDTLNEIMANSLFNLDILYDAIIENSDELFQITTTLNKKINNLKTKRKKLESKIDSLLFSNNNTDGYFYSYIENFSSIENIDISLSTAYVDAQFGSATLSQETSDRYSIFAIDNINNSSVELSIYENGSLVNSVVSAENFNNVFDGLTDTYWSHEHRTIAPVPVALKITIPVSSTVILSKISGYILTSSPVSVTLNLTSVDGLPEQTILKNSLSDYSAFNFLIESKGYKSIDILMIKNEPDYVDLKSKTPYVYRMGLRDLIFSSTTRSKTGIIVSSPISLPTQVNKSFVIDAVSIDVEEKFTNEGSVRYFVGQDIPNASSISDFNWFPISPNNSQNSEFNSVINFNGSNKVTNYISNTPNAKEVEMIPLNSTSNNINDLNPNINIYQDKSVYRIAALDLDIEYINPLLLGNVDSFKHYYVLDVIKGRYTDLPYWFGRIRDGKTDDTLLRADLTQVHTGLNVGINTPNSGFLTTKLICANASSFINTISKSTPSLDLAVYINGIMVSELPSGKLNHTSRWDLIEGINDILITYDKTLDGSFSITLTDGDNLSTYGTMFTDYFFYLDKFDFSNKNMKDNLYFTIDKIFGRKELLASSPLQGRSKLDYITKSNVAPAAIRFRADLIRYNNPFSTPAIDQVRVKFKHKDL